VSIFDNIIFSIHKIVFYSVIITPGKKNSLRKLKLPSSFRKNFRVIYDKPCLDCFSIYSGETFQLLKNRIYKHKQNITNDNVHTTSSNHAITKAHSSTFNTAIVRREKKMARKEGSLRSSTLCEMMILENFKSD